MFSALKALTGTVFENKKESLLNVISFIAKMTFSDVSLTENGHTQ